MQFKKSSVLTIMVFVPLITGCNPVYSSYNPLSNGNSSASLRDRYSKSLQSNFR